MHDPKHQNRPFEIKINMTNMPHADKNSDQVVIGTLTNGVINRGICTGCGACCVLDTTHKAYMRMSSKGPLPNFSNCNKDLPKIALSCCPGLGIHYPALYLSHYGCYPENGLLGHYIKVRVGHAADPVCRRNSSSGGVITCTLQYLLKNRLIDQAIVICQGTTSSPIAAQVVFASTESEIARAAQSVYIPVSVLDILTKIDLSKTYAITCLPDQAAGLRMLQQAKVPAALRIRYVLGPYTGTGLEPAVIPAYLKSKGVAQKDAVISLKWRAGEWPGQLEIKTESGHTLRSKKFYYNYLIPFFITRASLQSMDFTNEFCDLSAGDAWSPIYEGKKGGFNVFTTRSAEMEAIINEMIEKNILCSEEIDPQASLSMHGHMLDFKKRGAYVRNKIFKFFGKSAPDTHLQPSFIPISRWIIEIIILMIIFLAKQRFSRWLVSKVPEKVIGPIFNVLRKSWKALSKPSKRKGLRTMQMENIE